MVKRAAHLFEKMISDETLNEAVKRACEHRSHISSVIRFSQNKMENLAKVRQMLIDGTYKTSPYRTFQRKERGKVRDISALPFFPDRIVHWALTLATRDVFLKTFTARTYAAIPGRGSHKALRDLKHALRSGRFTFALKMDVHHYFASIDKDILMEKVEHRIKDPRILDLYREVIYGYPGPGIPIGNLTSQYLANLYLSDLDHILAERYHATAFRYMDDIIVLGWDTAWLRRVRTFTVKELAKLKLDLNANWQIFRIESRGVDFVGYRSWSDHILLRTATKKRMRRKMRNIANLLKMGAEVSVSMRSCVASYSGILKWCDGWCLRRRYIDPVMEKIGCKPTM